MPIRRGVVKIGVLVVQQREMDHFTLLDERALRTAATQLAGAIENARLLMALASEPAIQTDAETIAKTFPHSLKANPTDMAQHLARSGLRENASHSV